MTSPTGRSSGEVEVVHAGDAEHGVVDAVAFEAVVAEDLPELHAGEDMLDAGRTCLWDLLWASFQPGNC